MKKAGQVLDSYWDLDNCNMFCRQWQHSNGEQVECLTGQKIRLIYCSKVGPKQYDLSFAIGENKVINWFGTACCSYCATAKAYQSYCDDIV